MTPAEQFFLEQLNRARLDPLAEAARFDIDLNQGLSGPPLTGEARQPLAPNAVLRDASAAHSQWMLDTNTFSHTGEGGSTATARIQAVMDLQPAWRTGENISWSGTTGTVDLDSSVSAQHRSLFLSPGHRTNILEEFFDQIGVAQVRGPFTHSNGVTYDTSMITNKFVGQDATRFLTGVVYDDTDGDGFYSIGEGHAGVTITANGQSATSAAAGGYTISLPAAQVDVIFDWEGTMLAAQVDLSGGNVKLDLVDGLRLLSSGDLVLGNGVIEAGLLGVADLSLTGNALDNLLIAGSGNNTLNGGGGSNTAVFAGAQADYSVNVESGIITVTDQRSGVESQGVNTLRDINTLQFADGTVTGLIEPDPDGDTHLLAGHVRSLDGAALDGTEVGFFVTGSAAPSHETTATADGGFTLQALAGSTGRLDATRAYDAAEDGRPSALDALDVLRMAVGLTPSFGPGTPAAFVAADMDGNGRVEAQDALEVLRAAVGLASDHAPRWVFVDAENLPVMDRTSVDFQSGIALDMLDADHGALQLTGILTGHMSEFG